MSKENKKMADMLCVYLADTYSLYLKTQNFHWNVKGINFAVFHQMFQTQYEELALAVDAIAEMIRILGHDAPGSFSAFAKLSHIKDQNKAPTAVKMIAELKADHQHLIAESHKIIDFAEKHHFHSLVDFATLRSTVHEKTVWMLDATLQK